MESANIVECLLCGINAPNFSKIEGYSCKRDKQAEEAKGITPFIVEKYHTRMLSKDARLY